MIASGTTIERIVRGWRRRWPSDIWRDRGDLLRERRVELVEFVPAVSVRGVRTERGCGLHGLRPDAARLLVRHRPMVLPVCRSSSCRRSPAVTGWIRPLPRTRLMPLATGVQSRTK